MIDTIVLATGNRGKLAEFSCLLEDVGIQVESMKSYPNIGEITEDGTTFTENALIKARSVAKATGKVALADDSGLVVDALDGAPGIYSARFAGEPSDDAKNNAKLLERMEGIPDSLRDAHFHCAIAIVTPDGREYTTEGICNGRILREEKGEGGFGYDPLFFVEQFRKTFAELSMEEKNTISHRSIANAKAVEIIKNI